MSVVLSAALVALGIPSTAASASPSEAATPATFVQNAGSIFRVDWSELSANLSSVVEGAGSFSVPLTRAVFPGESEPDAGLGSDFVFGEEPSVDDIEFLGSNPSDVEAATGRSPDDAQDWQEVITWTVTGSFDEIRTSYRVGDDTLLLSIPWVALGAEFGDLAQSSLTPVVVEVNGFPAEVDPELLQEIMAGMIANGAVPQLNYPAHFRDLFDRFNDPARFVNAYAAFHLIAGSTALASPTAGCFHECLGCVGAGLGVLGGALGTVALCGSAGATAGLTVLGCVGGIFGTGGAIVLAAIACTHCYGCTNPPEPKPKDPGGGSGGTGGENCPSDCKCCGEPLCDCAN